MDRERFARVFVGPQGTIREAIEAIDAGAAEIALVADERKRLLGTISDGDLRRGLLRGIGLGDPLASVVHREPITAAHDTDPADLLRLMRSHTIHQVPLIRSGRVVDVALLPELLRTRIEDHQVVLMAGGEGVRLRPLTADVPKPMLPVGDRPLLETVLDQVRQAGFERVLLAVSYRSEAITDHFGDGSDLGLSIRYLHESSGLGSAGALRVAREELDRPFVVMNADLLTNVNLAALLRFHQEDGNLVTVGVRQYVLEVPYGVVTLDGARVTSLEEKPRLPFFINAGIYAATPAAIDLMPPEQESFHMTDLIERALAHGERVGSFPVHEYWLDIGQLADYERSHSDHGTYFSRSA